MWRFSRTTLRQRGKSIGNSNLLKKHKKRWWYKWVSTPLPVWTLYQSLIKQRCSSSHWFMSPLVFPFERNSALTECGENWHRSARGKRCCFWFIPGHTATITHAPTVMQVITKAAFCPKHNFHFYPLQNHDKDWIREVTCIILCCTNTFCTNIPDCWEDYPFLRNMWGQQQSLVCPKNICLLIQPD